MLWLLSILILPLRPVYAAEPEQKPSPTEQKPAEPAEKPLEPGWLSLDSSVGVADRWIALNKAAVEGAIGIGISGYLDTTYTWSSNLPENPPESAVGYFYGDQNKVNFNSFHIGSTSQKRIGVLDSIYPVFRPHRRVVGGSTLWGKTFHKAPSAQVREAYITSTIPLVREFNSKAVCL